jgi:hypothetical protein
VVYLIPTVLQTKLLPVSLSPLKPKHTQYCAVLRQNECKLHDCSFIYFLLSSAPFHVQNTNSTTKCIYEQRSGVLSNRAVAVANRLHCIVCCWAVIRTGGYIRLYRLTAQHIAMYGCTGLATETTTGNLLYKKALTVCYQWATCFGALGALSRNLQQLLFSLYSCFKLLIMDLGGWNMQQADYRQMSVSHWSVVYWILLVLWLARIVIALPFSWFPTKDLQLEPG